MKKKFRDAECPRLMRAMHVHTVGKEETFVNLCDMKVKRTY